MNNNLKLFEAEKTNKVYNKSYTCRYCSNRERWQCGSKVIQYCKVRVSKRTSNGLLKIKCKDKACILFKLILNK